MVQRAYKFRFYPTPEQAELLARTFGCVRFVWNNTLAWRSALYKEDGTSVSYGTAERRLVPLKQEFPWLAVLASGATGSGARRRRGRRRA